MKHEKLDSVPAIGGTSLLVIFSVLCLTVFSLLTLTTAHSQKRLSDSTAEACAAYYEADRQAEEIFALLRSGQTHPQVHRDGSDYTYSVPITQHQSLLVRLRHNQSWQVLCWQAAVTTAPIHNQPLSLWDGGSSQEVSP
jgi:hypothetical protein